MFLDSSGVRLAIFRALEHDRLFGEDHKPKADDKKNEGGHCDVAYGLNVHRTVDLVRIDFSWIQRLTGALEPFSDQLRLPFIC